MAAGAAYGNSALVVAVLALLLALGLAAGALLLGRRWAGGRPRELNPPFEQGRAAAGQTWVQFRPRYAVLALLFVAFDMEMVFMFPWAVAFVGMGLTAFLDMLVFVAILGSALAFAWREGALDWEG